MFGVLRGRKGSLLNFKVFLSFRSLHHAAVLSAPVKRKVADDGKSPASPVKRKAKSVEKDQSEAIKCKVTGIEKSPSAPVKRKVAGSEKSSSAPPKRKVTRATKVPQVDGVEKSSAAPVKRKVAAAEKSSTASVKRKVAGKEKSPSSPVKLKVTRAKKEPQLSKQNAVAAVPLAQEIYEAQELAKLSKPKITVDTKRMNIVSESLCDDVIERLSSSLEKHKHCDIIDVNPGIGLFSSKLHDVLKPRTHVLMEPDAAFYSKWLQPHIDSDPSYKVFPASGIVWSNLNKLSEEGYLPDQTRLPQGHPDLQKTNNTLLFVANLGYYPAKLYFGFSSVAQMVMHQLLSAARTNSLFHSYGKIRMLLWALDKEKAQMLPRVSANRRKAGIEAEIICENIYEIAGADATASVNKRERRRDAALDDQSAQRVRDTMIKMGIKTPPGRMGTIELEANGVDVEGGSNRARVRRKYRDYIAETEAKFERGELPEWTEDGQRSAEWLHVRKLKYQATMEDAKATKSDTFLPVYDSIMDGFRQLADDKSADREAKLAELTSRFVAWRDSVETLSPNSQASLWIRIQDRQLLNNSKPVLLWDRRLAEPLKVSSNEFFPQTDMCLLDMHPKATWPLFQGDRAGDYDFFEFILTGFFTAPTQSVARGLKAIAPGALEWIEPRCPSFTDVANGGSIDAEHLLVRTMSETMFKEMFEAWMSWPFKPSKAQLSLSMGSQAVGEELGLEFDGHVLEEPSL